MNNENINIIDEKLTCSCRYIQHLEELSKSQPFKDGPNEEEAFQCINNILKTYYKCDIEWIKKGLIEKAKRKKGKYDNQMRYFFFLFVSIMKTRGASLTQSINLLTDITGNNMSKEGFFKEVNKSYKYHNLLLSGDILNNSIYIDLCKYLILYSKVENITLENRELSFIKAYNIYQILLTDITNHLKEQPNKNQKFNKVLSNNTINSSNIVSNLQNTESSIQESYNLFVLNYINENIYFDEDYII